MGGHQVCETRGLGQSTESLVLVEAGHCLVVELAAGRVAVAGRSELVTHAAAARPAAIAVGLEDQRIAAGLVQPAAGDALELRRARRRCVTTLQASVVGGAVTDRHRHIAAGVDGNARHQGLGVLGDAGPTITIRRVRVAPRLPVSRLGRIVGCRGCAADGIHTAPVVSVERDLQDRHAAKGSPGQGEGVDVALQVGLRRPRAGQADQRPGGGALHGERLDVSQSTSCAARRPRQAGREAVDRDGAQTRRATRSGGRVDWEYVEGVVGQVDHVKDRLVGRQGHASETDGVDGGIGGCVVEPAVAGRSWVLGNASRIGPDVGDHGRRGGVGVRWRPTLGGVHCGQVNGAKATGTEGGKSVEER